MLKVVNNYYNPQQQLSDSGIGRGWNNLMPNDYISSLQLPDVYRSIAYSCINVRAEKLSSPKIKLQQKLVNGKMKDIPSHPFYDLMENPNIYRQSFKAIVYGTCVNLDLPRGESFWYTPLNRLKMPVGIYLIPSKYCYSELTPDLTQIWRYRYQYGTKTVYYYPEEIVHFKIYNPDNPFIGKGISSAARYQLDIDGYQSIYQKNFYLNDAALGTIFKIPGTLKGESYDRLKEQVNKGYGDPTNAGKPFLLEGVGDGAEVVPFKTTPKEADYMNSRKALVEEICAMYRVPKSVIGLTENVQRANAETNRITFVKDTIIPFSFNIWDKIEQFIKVNYDERIYLNADYSLEEPFTDRMNAYAKNVNLWIRPNEIRAREELPEDWDNAVDGLPNPNANIDTTTQDQTTTTEDATQTTE